MAIIIKITQPNSMILVSISSADVDLFDDVKRHDTFRLQGTEIRRSTFYGTPGILKNVCLVVSYLR